MRNRSAMPLIEAHILGGQMRTVGERLRAALDRQDLQDEDSEQSKKSQNTIKQTIIDYVAVVRLYIEACRAVRPKN